MNKQRLIIIPGAGCDVKFYDNVLPIFNEYFNTSVISYNGNTLEEYEKSLIEKLNKIDENYIVLGHCLGGAIITRCIAMDKLKNINGLILCNSIANFTVFKKTFFDKNNEEYTNFYIDDDINSNKVIEAKKHLLPEENIKNHLNISFLIDNREILKTIKIPIFTICSDKDGYFNLKEYLITLDCCKKPTLGFVENARHLGLLTHTKSYLDKIINWYELCIYRG